MYEVVIPTGVAPGQQFHAIVGDKTITLTCPDTAGPGSAVQFDVPAHGSAETVTLSDKESTKPLPNIVVAQPPLGGPHAGHRCSATYGRKRKHGVCCFVGAALLVVFIFVHACGGERHGHWDGHHRQWPHEHHKDHMEKACNCPAGKCDQSGCDLAECLGGGCVQTDALVAHCMGGECNQMRAGEATCTGGGCNQALTLTAKCLGGGCNQICARTSAKCFGGDCDQRGAHEPHCTGGSCQQGGASGDSSCVGGGCTDGHKIDCDNDDGHGDAMA